MKIGQRIKEARLAKGLTEEELGKKINRSKSAISNYEKNSRGISPLLIIQLIRILDVDANYFFQDYFPDQGILPSKEDLRLLDRYHEADSYSKNVIDRILETDEERKKDKAHGISLFNVPLYNDLKDFITDDRLRSIAYPLEDIKSNRKASCLLYAFEDDMYPIYSKNDCLLIQRCSKIAYDEIGIFKIDDQYHIRKMGINELVCEDGKKKAIPMGDNVACLGKVLRKISGYE